MLPDGTISSEEMNSLNHYTYGSIEAWMFADVCGIRQAAPGFKTAVIAPHPDSRLGYLKGKLSTAAGDYESSWEYTRRKDFLRNHCTVRRCGLHYPSRGSTGKCDGRNIYF